MKVALVGCGAVSRRYYAPALRALEASGLVEVIGLHDPDAAAARDLIRQFPAAVYAGEWSGMPWAGVDLAIVASPPARHAEQTVNLLGAGISVLCEKPMAVSAAEAQAMVEASSLSSAVLAVGMSRRFLPATQTIRRMLALGVLGKIDSLQICEGGPFRWPVSSPSYFRRRAAGGGVLMDIGVHALDLMIWWLGEPVEIAYQDDAMGGIEVNCRLRCDFAAGFSADMRLSRDCALANRYVIRGENGSLAWTVNEANRLAIGFEGDRRTLNAALEESGRPAATFEQSFIAQIRNVVAALRGEEPLLVPAAEALASLRLIERCYGNRRPMTQPWFGEQEALRAAELGSSKRGELGTI